MSVVDQELLRCVWNGTFYHNQHKARFDASNDGHCPRCGQPDGHEHRGVFCPADETVRLCGAVACYAGVTYPPCDPWACILANNSVIAAEVLPGLPQCIDRAELYALWRALCWSVRYSCQIELWTDSACVYQRYQELVDELRQIPPGRACQDLWQDILAVISLMDAAPCIDKVKAHRSPADAMNEADASVIQHNLAQAKDGGEGYY